MENIVKLILGIAFITFVSYLAYQIVQEASSDTYLRLRTQLDEVEEGNRQLERKNERLRIQIESLRKDKRAIERQIRDELGLMRSDEVLIRFEQKPKAPENTP